MILLAGAFELVPLLAVLLLAVVLALPAALVVPILGGVLRLPVLGGLVLAALLVAAVWVAERAFRSAETRRVPVWACRLDVLGRSEGVRIETVGGRAVSLGRLARLGVPVPDGIVLTSELVERIRLAAGGEQDIERVWRVLPSPARRELDAFLDGAKGKVVVRASFTDHGPKHSYAGVFPSVRDVDPGSREALIASILSVLGSSDDAIGREYRRRRGAGPGVARAVVVQRQIDGEVAGAMVSRGPSAMADSVIVDVARRRSPLRSFHYDLVEGKAAPLGFEDSAGTPAWMHRLAVLAVTLEAEFGGPVKVEYAVEDGQPYVLDVRRITVPERKTWVHARPLDASTERMVPFALELRGGLPLVRRVLERMLERAGAAGPVREDEVRYADGLVYVDAEVVRRALARLGADVLLSGGLTATLRSTAAVKPRPLPSVPTVTEITKDAWPELRAWHGEHLLGAASVRLELVAREWLIHTLLRLVDGDGTSKEARRGHPALRWLLRRRVRQASDEAERQRGVLEKAEAELGSAVARVLARSAGGWNAMFKGDRHLHATLDEIDRWQAEPGAREALETEWRSRGVAFDRRKDQPMMARVHRPALPEQPADAVPVTGPMSIAPGRTSSRAKVPKLAGVAAAGGIGKGPLVLLAGHEPGKGEGAIIALAEMRPELSAEVYDARGVVLLSGGLASSVVELAAELGVPAVLCPGARGFATEDVTIDGSTGTVQVHR